MISSAGARESQRNLAILTATVVLVTVVGALYWAQSILIPIALAVFLTFVLSPIVNSLRRLGMPRIISVLIVLFGISLVLIGVAGLITTQSRRLMEDLPQHTDTIKERVKSLKSYMSSRATTRLQDMVDEVSQEVTGTRKPPAAASPPTNESATQSQNLSLMSHTPGLSWLWPSFLSSTASAAGTAALSFVLVAFMLMKREDLRDRFLRLIGDQRLAATTKAMDDAGRRISRFLLMQFIINSIYGLVLGVGLLLIGIPYAILWGVLSAILRYIPYLGPWLAAIPPVLLSLVISNSAPEPIMTIALVILLEIITNNVLEPTLYGSSLGVSQVALIVSAAFWAFLWGPVGLVLSGPLTVILLVLGQRVPQLRILSIILGEDVALDGNVRFFQRLVASDRDEALEVLETRMRDAEPIAAADEIIVPALNMIVESERTGELDVDDVSRMQDRVIEIGENAFEVEPALATDGNGVSHHRGKLIILPVNQESHRGAAFILSRFFRPGDWEILLPPTPALVSESVEWIQSQDADVVCLVSLQASGQSQVRYFCKRLAARGSERRIIVAKLGMAEATDPSEFAAQYAGVQEQTSSLEETVRLINSWLPVVDENRSKPAVYADVVN